MSPSPARSGRPPRRLALVALALALSSCSGLSPRPATGELTFRLTWTGRADLDLYVVSPLDEQVNFAIRRAPSGGELDVDCNVRDHLCPQPMENVYWPRGRAPAGTYRYWIVVANDAGLAPGDTFSLRVLARGRLVSEWGGLISDLETRHLGALVDFS